MIHGHSRLIRSGHGPHPSPLPTGEGTRRGGAILVVVLGCLAVAAAMSVVVVRQIAVERREAKQIDRNLQARWLVEAGIERAADRLASDAEYIGETWTIPAEQLAGADGAVVRIRVDAVEDHPSRRIVRVEADLGDAPESRCRRVKQASMDLEVFQPKPSTEAADKDREKKTEVNDENETT